MPTATSRANARVRPATSSARPTPVNVRRAPRQRAARRRVELAAAASRPQRRPTAQPAAQAAPRRRPLHGMFGTGLGALSGFASTVLGAPEIAGLATAGGEYLGEQLGRLVGFGDYKVKSNSLVRVDSGAAQATFSTNRGVRICHREFIQDVDGTTAFGSNLFHVNPGDSTLFPWMSKIAQRFTKYKFHGLLFQYVPTSSSIGSATNPSLGTVVMSSNYDPDADAFPTKQAAESAIHTISVPPCNAATHTVECAPAEDTIKFKYVRNPSVNVANSELRFSDHSLFQLSTAGMQSVYKIGELWITYDLELIDPLLSGDSLGSDVNQVSCGRESAGLESTIFIKDNLIDAHWGLGNGPSAPVTFGSLNVRPLPLGQSVNTINFWQQGYYYVVMHVETHIPEASNIAFSNTSFVASGGLVEGNKHYTNYAPYRSNDASGGTALLVYYSNGVTSDVGIPTVTINLPALTAVGNYWRTVGVTIIPLSSWVYDYKFAPGDSGLFLRSGDIMDGLRSALVNQTNRNAILEMLFPRESALDKKKRSSSEERKSVDTIGSSSTGLVWKLTPVETTDEAFR